jgi:two-component system nitrate/nitrite response regulator NarL
MRFVNYIWPIGLDALRVSKIEMINVLLIEPDPVRREGLLAYLSYEPEFKVLGAGSDFVEALEAASPLLQHVDVLIINTDQPTAREPVYWAVIHMLLPTTKVVALTDGEDEHILVLILCAGITSLYKPEIKQHVLIEVVRNAALGVVDYDISLVDRVKRALIQPAGTEELHIGELTIDLRVGDVKRLGKRIRLTPREREVLTLLGEGRSNRQIALELKVKESTIAYHVSNILKNLGVSSRAEAGIVSLMLMRWKRLP